MSTQDPQSCERCECKNLRQEEDILDTWFSSALWPFSTLGWPAQTAELKRYYPTAVLITGFDIIFFWVARMMMFGQHFMGMVPFKDVYIHALIRDASGDKMSKSKGNVVNPLSMIDTYGVDAFRFTLAAFAGHGRDVRWDEQRAAGYHKFVNKIWQAFRFMFSHLPEGSGAALRVVANDLSVYDRWILARLGATTGQVREALDTYRFSDAAAAVYAFVWDEFCDWYLEISKTVLYSDTCAASHKDANRATLVRVFEAISRLLEPFMPFLAEELWQRLSGYARPSASPGSVLAQPYPTVAEFPADAAACAELEFVTRVVVAIRRVRADYNVLPKQRVTVLCKMSSAQLEQVRAHNAVISALTRADLQDAPATQPPQAALVVVESAELWIPLAGLVDFAAEGERLRKEIAKIDKDCERLNKQLESASFVARAPEEVVEEKRLLLKEAYDNRQRLEAALVRLG